MLFVFLLLFWLMLNGKFTLEILVFGILLSAAITLFCRRQGIWTRRVDRLIVRLAPKIIKYLAILFVDMIESSLSVIKIILTPGYEEVQPRLLFFDPPTEEDLSHFILANSITLTPGTFSIGLFSRNILAVHALNKEMCEGARNMNLIPLLVEMEEILAQEGLAKHRGKEGQK